MKQKFKDLIERNRWIKWIPNSLTLCNSLCGFVSILITCLSYHYAASGNIAGIFAFSCGMILFAMVFDAFDGFAARLLNAGSMHGLQMDSLADMVTFGVAPAVLTAMMANHYCSGLFGTKMFIVIALLCAVYLGCAALRLATYNVHAILEKKSSEKFSGLPSPGGAAAICSVVIFTASAGIDQSVLFPFWLPVYAAILGLLMVSSIPYMHFAKWIISCKRDKRRLAFLILLFILWGVSGYLYQLKFGTYNWYAFPTLVVNVYVFWGPVAYFAVKLGLLHAKVEFVNEDSAEDKNPDKAEK